LIQPAEPHHDLAEDVQEEDVPRQVRPVCSGTSWGLGFRV
jgi:hypothetical protein